MLWIARIIVGLQLWELNVGTVVEAFWLSFPTLSRSSVPPFPCTIGSRSSTSISGRRRRSIATTCSTTTSPTYFSWVGVHATSRHVLLRTKILSLVMRRLTNNNQEINSINYDDDENDDDVPLRNEDDPTNQNLDDVISNPMLSFDDFGGRSVGDSDDDDNNNINNYDNSASMTVSKVLKDRLTATQQQEYRQDAVTGRNWKRGNWEVRGFSVEDNNNGSNVPTTVCRIVASATNECNMIWVGRTDGSVLGVRLGSAYWTRLNQDNVIPGEVNINNSATTEVSQGQEVEEYRFQSASAIPPTTDTPFEITTQLNAGNSSVTALAMAFDEEHDATYLYTATQDQIGVIQQWHIYDSNIKDNDFATVTRLPDKQLQGSHEDVVLFLKVVTLDDIEDTAAILLSADSSTIAVWEVSTGKLLGKVGITTCIPSSSIQCIDADSTHIFVGTSTGHIVVYRIDHLIAFFAQSSSTISTTTTPLDMAVGQWFASNTESPITAVCCGDTTYMGAGRTMTRTLYTGDANGIVKQWLVFARSSLENNNVQSKLQPGRVEQWPKLPTQRLPQKAHMFRGHCRAVQALINVDGLKFVSAASDGTGMFSLLLLVCNISSVHENNVWEEISS